MDIIKQDIEIDDKIFIFRDKQVMIDRDLAMLYQVETKALNQAVKRNIERFPEDFRFQLSDEEKNELVTKCDRFESLKYSKTNPYAFTEQGVSMLSAVLKSKVAVEVSIKIIRAFVKMRNFLSKNAYLFEKIEQIEKRQIGFEIETNSKFDKVFKALENKKSDYTQGLFYDGQIFDAYVFVNNLIKSAKKEIILIDNYVDETVLILFSKNPDIKYTLVTKELNKKLKLDIQKYKKQYKNLEVKISSAFHDRFLIIDKKELYHIGASLKDLGKRCFAFSKLNINIDELISPSNILSSTFNEKKKV